MNGSNEKAITGKIMIDFEYFIQLAIRKEIPWKSLAFMMTDLATTLDISKQIIRALVQELEKWVLKVENNSNHDVTRVLHANEKQANISIPDEKQNIEETIEDLDNSEDESIVDETEELCFETYKEELGEKELDNQTESIQHEDRKIIVDFSADEFYEFIGNNDKPSPVSSSDDEEHALPKEDTRSNDDSEEKQMEQNTERGTIDNKKGNKSFCGKCFLTKGHKETHERIHTGERPFECKFCPKRFIGKFSLTRHERIHTGEKPFQCQTCEKCFNDTGALKNHKRIHTGEKPYQCKTCNTSYRNLSSLKHHQRIHQ